MTAQKKKIPVNRLTYTGQGSELFKMWLVNLLLTIPTVGIYRFWAKAKIRRYQAAHVKLGNAFFEHTGNGKELFVGFLKVMAIIFCVLILYMVPEFLGLPSFVSGIVIAATYAAVFYFLAVARYASVRYMASRTTWRGIRGHLGGSAIKYANFSIKRTLLNIVTLGVKKPESDILKHKFIMDNLQFGAQKFAFQGHAKGLLSLYFMGFAGYLIAGFLFALPIIIEAATATVDGSNSAGGGIFSAICYFLAVVLLIATPFLMFKYIAALAQRSFGGLRLGNLRFKNNVTAIEIFKLMFGNILITIFTLGFGTAIVWKRNMMFTCKHIMIGGDLEAFSTQQIAQQKASVGEGLGDALDLDTGFDIGL